MNKHVKHAVGFAVTVSWAAAAGLAVGVNIGSDPVQQDAPTVVQEVAAPACVEATQDAQQLQTLRKRLVRYAAHPEVAGDLLPHLQEQVNNMQAMFDNAAERCAEQAGTKGDQE